MTGLVIKSPWIDLILSGQKTWEIRGSRTQMRERIALIKSKSGTVIGGCDVVDCIGPLTHDQLRATAERHRIPLHMLDRLPYPQTYAWVVGNPKPLATPIAYRHPSGAVIWVRLDQQNVVEFGRLIREIGALELARVPQASALRKEQERSTSTGSPVRDGAEAVIFARTSPNRRVKMANDDLCRSFSIQLEDGSEVVPCRVRDKDTGERTFKVSKGGNTSDDAILVRDEGELRQYVKGMGYRVRCKSRDGERRGLFSGRSPNRIKDLP